MCGRASLVEKGLNRPFAAPNSVGRVDKGTLTFLLDDSHNHPVGTPFLWGCDIHRFRRPILLRVSGCDTARWGSFLRHLY